MTNQAIINLITGIYVWFNQIADPTQPFNQSDLESRFTPDFVMQMNGKILTWDYSSLWKHFNTFRQEGGKIKVHLPLEEIIISEDKSKCVARYTITKTHPQKGSYTIHVIAIWHIHPKGLLQRMNEVVYIAQDKDKKEKD